MKPSKLFSSLIVSIICVGSFFALTTKKLDSRKIEPIEAASSISDNVYLELDANIWGSADAYYTIHYWGGSNPSSWPGTPLNGGNKASGNVVISATWDPTSIHVMIMRWGNAQFSTEWNRWYHFDSNSFTKGSYNYFKNDGESSCASRLVYENTGFAYFGNKDDWSNVHAYIFHSSYSGILSLGPWPGTEITNSSDITFDGVTGLYRISFTKVLGNMIIFNNNSGNQTKDLSLLNDGYYKTDYLTTGDGERGAAADFVYNLNMARKAVAGGGDIKEGSICGISTGTAASLATTYSALSGTSKGYVNSATIYTYKDQNSNEADTHVSVSAMMQQLSDIGGTPLSAFFVPTANEKFSGLIFVSISSIIFLLYFGVRYLVKKNPA